MKEKIDALKDKLFKKIHGNNLVYNTCWEDPRIDRELLKLDANSKVVMITSAGCNALDYALDKPAEINCVDMNFRQNALLEFKKANFEASNHEVLFQLFGNGYHREAGRHYFKHLRKRLPEYARDFWDKKHFYFHKGQNKKSFYFFGTAGSFAWLFNKYLNANEERKELIQQLFACETIEEQKEVYTKLEPVLMNKMVKWLMNRHITMSLLGVPRSQRQLILEEYNGGVGEFLQARLKHIFTELPIKDNYFWQLYTFGCYTKTNCPEYLKEENFATLQEQIHTIKTHNTTISQFLKDKPGKYTHFILLDHQDWLAQYDLPALEEEWALILKNSAPGAKILMRSASNNIDYLPKRVFEVLDFDPNASRKHQFDRVGTYGSTYLGVRATNLSNKTTRKTPSSLSEA